MSTTLVSAYAALQAATGVAPELLALVAGVVIVLSMMLAEVLKQVIGPMFASRRGDDVPTQLLKRVVGLLERAERKTGDLMTMAERNQEWHDEKDPGSGLPRAYFPRQEIVAALDDIVARLRRVEKTGSGGA